MLIDSIGQNNGILIDLNFILRGLRDLIVF